MATYLYGLALTGSSPRIPAGAQGVVNASVRAFACGDLCAIASTVDRTSVRPTLDAVRQHDGVLQRVVDDGATIAAVRFGQLFDDDDACRHHVAERADRLVHLLREHDGTVEMRVLVPHSSDEPPARQLAPNAGPGRAYLESLRVSGTISSHQGLRDALGPMVRAERVEGLPQSRGIAFVHLVKREDLNAYRTKLASMPGFADARVVGPLALYTFAEPAA